MCTSIGLPHGTPSFPGHVLLFSKKKFVIGMLKNAQMSSFLGIMNSENMSNHCETRPSLHEKFWKVFVHCSNYGVWTW